MIERSPCEYYLKYLITHPDGYDDERIQDIVQMQDLDFIGLPYLQRLRALCVAPNPFYPENKKHAKSQRFIRKEKLFRLYRPDETMLAANKLLGQPRAKELIESMLIAFSTPEWTAMALKHQGIASTPEAIELYAHYYFNLPLVDRGDIIPLLDHRVASSGSSDKSEQALRNSRFATAKRDNRRLLAGISIPNVATMMATMQLGVLPSSTEVSRIASATRLVAMGRALDSAHQGQFHAGQSYANIAESMHRILQEVGDADDDLQEGLARMALETDNQDVPYIGELAEGDTHTLDLQPLEKEEVDDRK